MAKNLVIQGSNAAMITARPDLTLSTAARSFEKGARSDRRLCRWLLHAGVAGLVGVGVLVVFLGVWLSSLRGASAADQRSNMPFEAWVLQPLVSGNLAIFLLWVWLDRMAIRFCDRNSETRDAYFLVVLLMVFASTTFCLCLAGMRGNEQVAAVVMVVCLPVLAVAVPLLWLAVSRTASLRLGALLLTGFVVASGFAQQRAAAAMNTGDDMSLFVMNSYLIGLAIAVWLLSLTVIPPARRNA